MIRIFCELFREPDVQLGFLWQGVTMGILLSLPLMLAGIAFIVVAQRRREPAAPTPQQPMAEH
jgi:phosphatidylglycerol:prolipoprotein diacylglycerol transferase